MTVLKRHKKARTEVKSPESRTLLKTKKALRTLWKS